MPSCRIKRYLGLPSAEVVCTGHKESKLKAEASMAELQARRWSQKRARVALSQAVANSDSGAPCGSLPREVGFKTASPEAPLRAWFSAMALSSAATALMTTCLPVEDLRLEESRVHVELQHNGYDCGLYMLQYIEKIAKSMPDLVCKKRRAEGVQLRWEDLGPEMLFTS